MIQTRSDIWKWNHNAGLLATEMLLLPERNAQPWHLWWSVFFLSLGLLPSWSMERRWPSFYPPWGILSGLISLFCSLVITSLAARGMLLQFLTTDHLRNDPGGTRASSWAPSHNYHRVRSPGSSRLITFSRQFLWILMLQNHTSVSASSQHQVWSLDRHQQLVRKQNSPAPALNDWIRTCILMKSPGDPYSHCCAYREPVI